MFFLESPFNDSPLFFMESRERRHQMLSFRCMCEACENNYPLFADLSLSPIRMALSKTDLQILTSWKPLSRKQASKYVKIVAASLEKIDKYVPCQDWVALLEMFPRCLISLYDTEDRDYLELTHNRMMELK